MIYILEETTELCTSAEGYKLFGFIGNLLNILKIVVPILIVLMGSIDLVKAITAGKDDDMKKAQKLFVKRLILGVVVFFIFPIVSLVFGMVDDANVNEGTNHCLKSMLNPSWASSKYESASKNEETKKETSDIKVINPEDVKRCEENGGIWYIDCGNRGN